jgi:hypothetical protein
LRKKSFIFFRERRKTKRQKISKESAKKNDKKMAEGLWSKNYKRYFSSVK